MGLATVAMTALAGCHLDMWRQNKVLPQQENEFFADNQGSRPLIAGTMPRTNEYGVPGMNTVHYNNPFYTGMRDGKLVTEIPAQALAAFGGDKLKMIHRGQERFDIYCSPCHGRVGDGNGMIAQRGFNLRRKPANYHTDKIRKLPDGHFFDVMTNGFGVMFSYADRVDPTDRWAIVSYIRTLQYSQNAPVADVPADKMADLDANASDAAPATGTPAAPNDSTRSETTR
jgi:mono/diheme cytochrome c family protein